MATPGKDYVVGKGRLYFELFPTGTKSGNGELYFGNTPELSTTADSETLDHYDADAGLNVKDESITIENNVTGAFVTDNISPENVALFFSGDLTSATVAAATALEEEFVAKRGRFIQLGTSEATPSGVRKVVNVVVAKLTPAPDPEDPPVSTPITPAGNLDIDLELGRVFIEPDAPDLADDDEIKITYDIEASTREVIVGKGTEIRGALRFISNNPVGTQKDYYWPYVKLTPNGDFALKGDEWQQIPFSFEVLKKDDQTERVYVDVRTR